MSPGCPAEHASPSRPSSLGTRSRSVGGSRVGTSPLFAAERHSVARPDPRGSPRGRVSLGGYLWSPHSTDGKTEPPRGSVTCPARVGQKRSGRRGVTAEQGSGPHEPECPRRVHDDFPASNSRSPFPLEPGILLPADAPAPHPKTWSTFAGEPGVLAGSPDPVPPRCLCLTVRGEGLTLGWGPRGCA